MSELGVFIEKDLIQSLGNACEKKQRRQFEPMIIFAIENLIKALINLSGRYAQPEQWRAFNLNGRGYGEGFLEKSVVLSLAIRIAENATGVRVPGADVV